MKRKPVLFILLVAGVVAAQSCKSLFKSDYAELEAVDLTTFVDAEFPEEHKRQFAQNEMIRKQLIDSFKKSFALAQAAEDEGIHKSDEFKGRLEFGIDQLLASKYIERNPAVIVSKEEWEAYYASHKDQFDTHFKLIAMGVKQPITDAQKEQQREIWSLTKVRSDKARQAGLDTEPGFTVLVKFRKADLLARLFARTLEEKNKLSDEDRKKYLAENPGADPDKLKEKAQGLLERVKKGESFEKIANEFNDDETKGRGGDLDWFGRGAIDPNFDAVAFALQKGQTSSEVVKSKFGYHIIRVDDRRMTPPKTAPMSGTQGQSQTPERNQEPKEEIRARHIYINTRASEQYETQLVKDKIKRAVEDATVKYAVAAPTDFIVKVAKFDSNRIPGGGQDGSRREIGPGEKK